MHLPLRLKQHVLDLVRLLTHIHPLQGKIKILCRICTNLHQGIELKQLTNEVTYGRKSVSKKTRETRHTAFEYWLKGEQIYRAKRSS